MKVLIIEDNQMKFARTAGYIKSIVPDAEIARTLFGEDGIDMIAKNKFDVAVIDMQMPDRQGNSTNAIGGIRVLNSIKAGNTLNPDMVYCINSGAEDSQTIMKINGFVDVQFILNTTLQDCSSDFAELLEKVKV